MSAKLYLVEWAIAMHGMYESLLEMYYFKFQVIDGLYMSYKLKFTQIFTFIID